MSVVGVRPTTRRSGSSGNLRMCLPERIFHSSGQGVRKVLRQPSSNQPLRASGLADLASAERWLRATNAGGSLRQAKDIQVQPTIETKTTFGRLVPWTTRSRRRVRQRHQSTRGKSCQRYACIARRPAPRRPAQCRFLHVFPPPSAPPSTTAGPQDRSIGRIAPACYLPRSRCFAEFLKPGLPMFADRGADQRELKPSHQKRF